MLGRLVVGALVAAALVGCSRDRTLSCESSERYATARSVPPVRVPDDLTLPDESNSLRLPPEPAPTGAPAEGCLEAPPSFFENRPGQTQPRDVEAAADDPERQISN